ncbi:flagellar biosynthetic protein FliR [Kordiimonas sediminis]|uniref:Flagellar biosynthetic protein FliR n=1 Tax=Kordiimonas sediminis TaxID=1735581 RepID=A0A919AV44_9PROT|nr:flagellar biosynthetic protein FliR [Kordiimonas sediminis]GHF27086.1 flagellar biosynthetic protein FliR [Kordiimonas sediminis]
MLSSILPSEAFAFLLVTCRMAAIVMLLPALGEQSVPRRIRVSFGFLLSLVVYSSVRQSLPEMPAGSVELAALIGREIALGIMIALMARLIMTAVHTAGTVLAFQSGLAAAQAFDPNQGTQSAIISTLMTLMAVTLIMVTNIHHLMIMGMVNSYYIFPITESIPFADFAGIAQHYVATSFTLGIMLAAPFIVYSLVYNLGLGLVARMMPQFQVFFIGMPVNIFLGFALFMVVVSSMMMVFLDHFEQYFLQMLG